LISIDILDIFNIIGINKGRRRIMEKVLAATRLDGATHRMLKEMALRQERTVAYLMRKAVEQFVEVEKEKEQQQ
jgi:hypothetical protein